MTDDGEDADSCEFLTAAVPEERLGFDRGTGGQFTSDGSPHEFPDAVVRPETTETPSTGRRS